MTTQLPTPHSSLLQFLARCKQVLSAGSLSANSRKLYLVDIKKFLLFTFGGDAVVPSVLSTQSTYQRYLQECRKQSSPAAVARTLCALRQLGQIVAMTHSIPDPTVGIGFRQESMSSVTNDEVFKYIKFYTNHLNLSHRSTQTIKSYKSDITQFLLWAMNETFSKDLGRLLTKKNIAKYADNLTISAQTSENTIARKVASLNGFYNWYTSAYPTQTLPDSNKRSTAAIQVNDVPDHSSNQLIPHGNAVKIKKRIFSHPSISFPSLVSFALLSTLLVGMTYFGYRQFSRDQVLLTQAYPSTPVTPNRQLSFQGRLESSGGTPITSATNLVFKLWDASSGGTQLYTTGSCSITPDSDGVFSTQIGSTCGSAIASTVFTENANVYLEVTVGAETLSPRQQIATVAYALNAETLQGFPIAATVSAIRNTVVPMNQWGEIIVGEQSPRLRGVSGTFQISAPALSIITTTGSNGNIAIAPDGTGQVNVTGGTTTTNFFNVSNSQLTTGSLITGTAATNTTGFKLLDLLSGSSPTSKFSVSDTGNVTLAGDLTVSGDDIFMGTNTAGMLLIADGTNFNPTAVSGDITINGSGVTAIGADKITESMLKAVNTASDENCLTYESTVGDFEWQSCGSSSGSNWRYNLGTISPLNDTVDLLVGANATASAKFAVLNVNSGTPTASISGGLNSTAAYLTSTGTLATTRKQTLTVGDTNTGNIILAPGGTTALTGIGADLTAAGALTTTSTLTSNGDLVANGTNITLGNAITDILDFQARVKQDADLIPITATGTNDLGSSTLPWDNLYINGITFGGGANFALADNTANAFQLKEGANVYMDITTTDNAESLTLNLPVGGATSHTANLFNANIAQTINIGTGTAADTINIGTGGTTTDVIKIGGLSTSHTDFTGAVNFAGGTTYFVDSSGNAKFLDLQAVDTGNPGLTVGNGSIGFARIGGSTISDNNGDLTLDSDTTQSVIAEDLQINGNDILDSGSVSRINLGATTTLTNTTTTLSGTSTLTASSLATMTTGSTVAWNVGTLNATSLSSLDSAAALTLGTTTLTLDSNATINGGSAANDDLTLQGTSNATRTTSYVLLQPNGGNVGIGNSAPTATLDVTGNATVSGNFSLGGQLQVGRHDLTPTALGAGSIYFDTNSPSATGDLYFYGSDSAWHSVAYGLTKFTANNTTVANGSYVEIAHNQATNDLSLTGWFKDTISNLYKNIAEYSHTITHNLQNQWSDANYTAFDVDTSGTLRNQLYAFWKMDESSSVAGTQVSRVDSYDNNHLTDNRSATSYIMSATGKMDNGADLELSNGNFLEIADNVDLSTGNIDFSLSAWVKLESETAGTTPEIIMSKSDAAGTGEFALYYTGATADDFAFAVYNSSGTAICTATDNTNETAGNWYHIVAIHDAIGNTCSIRVNNGTATSANETVSENVSDTTANFRIGARYSTEQDYFDGVIDEVGFWKKVLSTTEITNLYNSGNGNTYSSHSGFVRTQSSPTNVSLSQAVNIGSGADGNITISADTAIDTVNSIAGRSCADGGDAVNYSVTALTATTATLESIPSTGCLKGGDEVLLINMQGTLSGFVNVGNYETLTVANVTNDVVTFTTSKSLNYGVNATDDTGIGLTSSDQAVMLQRVPNYANVTVTGSGTAFSPSAWVVPSGSANNGAGEGGVMFFRANGTVSVGSGATITASSLGYTAATSSARGGASICGLGGQTAGSDGAGGAGSANSAGAAGGNGYCGGGGGGSVAGNGSTNSGGAGGGGGNSLLGGVNAAGNGGGGGYGTAGTGGTNGGSNGTTNSSGNGGGLSGSNRGGGGGGGTYGTGNLSKLFMGSSGGAGGASSTSVAGASGGAGGGIVAIHANTLTVSGTIASNGGAGSASGHANGGGNGAGGAGGSILFKANSTTVGTSLVTATGGAAGGTGAGTGGSGIIAISYISSISGSTNPSATVSLSGYNTYGVYHSPAIQTPNAAVYESLRWEVTSSTPSGVTNVEFQTRSGATSNPTDGTWEDWKPEANQKTSGCTSPNCASLSDGNTHTEWSGSASPADGDVTRNSDMYEDEDEATAGNLTKMTTTGFTTDTSGTLATSLTSYWPLNETSGTRSDVVASENLTANGTGGVGSTTGKVSTAADFESTESDFLEKTDDSTLSTGDIDFTVAGWVNLESESAGTTHMTILSKHESATVREYELYYTGATTDRFRFELFDSGGTSRCTVTDTTAVTTATWYYIVAWHSASGNSCNIQVNNNTATSAAETGVPSDTAANFRIGALNTTESSFFDGLVDEVGFWKKALTSTERTDLYNAGTGSAYPTNGQYLEDTIASTDLSAYDYITFWVRSSITGSTIKLGFGESAATEYEQTVLVDAASTWQKVYYYIGNIPSAARNAVTKLRITNLSSSAATIYLDNIQAELMMSSSAGSTVTSTPNNYFQYRIIFTTTNTAYYPSVENIQLLYTDGFKIVQTDTNTVRLYNYTGSTQDLRLDAVVFGADLAEWYTVNDDTIGAGDLVALTGKKDQYGVPILRKTNASNDPQLLGAISTKAGQTLGLQSADRRLLALAGRIPVKMDESSDPIKTGDAVTSSTVPGRARKAHAGELSIARATEDWQPGQSSDLLVIVNNTVPTSGIQMVDAVIRRVDGAWSAVSEKTGMIAEGISGFAKVVATRIESGTIATSVISPVDPTAPITIQGPVVISNSASASASPALVVEGEIAASTISARLAELQEIHAGTIVADQIIANRISAESIEGLDAKIAALSTGDTAELSDQDVTTITERIRSRIASLTESDGSAEDVPTPTMALADLDLTSSTATTSATLAAADIDFATVNNYLAVMGQATMTTLAVTDTLTVDTIQSTGILAIQPLGGTVKLAANTLVIDSAGEVAVNGNLTVAGRLMAESADVNALTIGTAREATSSALGNLLAVYNEQGVAVATIDASGSANLASLETNIITIAAGAATPTTNNLTTDAMSNATAGVGVLTSPATELTIKSPYVTANSLVYLTPTTNTDNKVLFVKAKESCTESSRTTCTPSFTVGIDTAANTDISFNWWIIELKN